MFKNRLILFFSLSLCILSTHGREENNDQCSVPFCVTPSELALCKVGWNQICNSAVCYNSNELCSNLEPEEKAFFALCSALEFTLDLLNCEDDFSARECAKNCYAGKAININEPVRGNCEAGACCNPSLPLCELERYYWFMSLGYGIASSEENYCKSSFESLPKNNGCEFLSDGISNDAIVCKNAGITFDKKGRNFCDITFAGTNDILDIIRQIVNFAPGLATERTYGKGENKITFTPNEIFRLIAEGDIDDESDGILDIAFQSALAKGCFTRENAAVHLMAHSMGAAISNLFVLKVAALYPNVYIRMTTNGEPTSFVKPLTGRASNIEAWSNKVRHINGRVLPRGRILRDFLTPRPYRIYQDYDPIPQLIPTGFMGGNNDTNVSFLCESLERDSLVYFIAGPEGCAYGRRDVYDELPNFPHRGGLHFPNDLEVEKLEKKILLLNRNNTFRKSLPTSFETGNGFLEDFHVVLKIFLSVADVSLQEDFLQLIDLHFLRRPMHLLGKLYDGGSKCPISSQATLSEQPLPANDGDIKDIPNNQISIFDNSEVGNVQDETIDPSKNFSEQSKEYFHTLNKTSGAYIVKSISITTIWTIAFTSFYQFCVSQGLS